MSSPNGYPWSYSTPQEFTLSWNAQELPETLALAKGFVGGGSKYCLPAEISPRSCLELALSVGRSSPHSNNISLMNEKQGASSYASLNSIIANPKRENSKSAPERKETPICFDFVQGKCRRQNCRYQHDFGAVIRHNSRESRICFDHLRGECTRGSLCRFSHDLGPLIIQSLEDAIYQISEPRASGICYDFCRGACPRRGNCPWTHNLIEIAWSTAKQPLHDHQKIIILRKVLEAVVTVAPNHMSEGDILQLLQQSIAPSKLAATPYAQFTNRCDYYSSTPYPYAAAPIGSVSSSSFNSGNLSEARCMEFSTTPTLAAASIERSQTQDQQQARMQNSHTLQNHDNKRDLRNNGSQLSSGLGLGFNYY